MTTEMFPIECAVCGILDTTCERMRAEVVQIAAVAVRWIRAMDERR